MPENLGPVVTDADLPTKKFVVDQVATAEEVAISATMPAVTRELWVDTSAAAADVVTRQEFDGVLARLVALETMVGGGA